MAVAAEPTPLVPDERIWLLAGVDPYEGSEAPEGVRAARNAVLARHEKSGTDDHGHEHHAHGEMSHHDMMEVRGDPSADGLVMEDIETVLGPVFAGLPTGLAGLAAS